MCTCDLAVALPAWQDPLSTRRHACGFCPGILSALVIGAVTEKRDDKEISLHSPDLGLSLEPWVAKTH